MRKSVRSPKPLEGFRYRADVLILNDAQELGEQIRKLPLKVFEFYGYIGDVREQNVDMKDLLASKLKA